MQLTRDDVEASSASEDLDIGDRKKAGEEALAQRKIVKVRRQSEGPVKNVFADIQLPTSPKHAASPKNHSDSLKKDVSPTNAVLSPLKKKDASPKKEQSPKKDLSPTKSPKRDPHVPANPFAALLTSPLPSAGTSPQPQSIFGNFAAAAPSGFGTFGTFGATTFAEDADESPEEEQPAEEETIPALSEVLNGEEGDAVTFQHDCKLFKLTREDDKFRWVERGSGFVRVLCNEATGKLRVIIRMKGVLRVLLNSPVLEDGLVEEGQKSVKFKAVDGQQLSWFRINLLQADQPKLFKAACLAKP